MPDHETVRSSDLIGRTVLSADGEPIGRIADLELDGDTVVAALVVTGRWGRLLGYERDSSGGPWLLETFANAVLRRDRRTLAWDDVRLADPAS